MPTPVVIVFVAAFGVSALILFVCAAAGLGQGVTARILEGVGGLLCVANAVGMPLVERVTVCSFLWFAAPVAALVNVVRIRQARKLHQEQLAATYTAER